MKYQENCKYLPKIGEKSWGCRHEKNRLRNLVKTHTSVKHRKNKREQIRKTGDLNQYPRIKTK